MKKAELLILLLLLAGLLVFGKNLGKQVSSSAVIAEQTDGQKAEKKMTRRREGKTVVLDPGHGGNDPGSPGGACQGRQLAVGSGPPSRDALYQLIDPFGERVFHS